MMGLWTHTSAAAPLLEDTAVVETAAPRAAIYTVGAPVANVYEQ